LFYYYYYYYYFVGVVVVVGALMQPRRNARSSRGSTSDKAAERERENPFCGECSTYRTNHFCSFILPSNEQCGAPVCAICKGEAETTRCSEHLWSGKFFIPDVGTQESQESFQQEVQQQPEQPTPIPIGNKQRKIVAKNALKMCAECKKYPTPLSCIVCQKPLCTTCKLDLNGTLGRYCCALHARKPELTFARNPIGQQAGAVQPSQSLPDPPSEQPLELSRGKAKKRKAKGGGANKSNSLLLDDKDALLHQAVSFDVSSDIGGRIVSQLRCSLSPSTLRNNSIVGTVSRKVSNKVSSGQLFYEVCWNNSEYGSMQMSHSHICLGMSNYIQLEHEKQQKKVPKGRPRRSDPYNNQDIIRIIDKSRGEDSDMSPCNSDCGSNGSVGSEDTLGNCFFGDNHIDRARAAEPHQIAAIR